MGDSSNLEDPNPSLFSALLIWVVKINLREAGSFICFEDLKLLQALSFPVKKVERADGVRGVLPTAFCWRSETKR